MEEEEAFEGDGPGFRAAEAAGEAEGEGTG